MVVSLLAVKLKKTYKSAYKKWALSFVLSYLVYWVPSLAQQLNITTGLQAAPATLPLDLGQAGAAESAFVFSLDSIEWKPAMAAATYQPISQIRPGLLKRVIGPPAEGDLVFQRYEFRFGIKCFTQLDNGPQHVGLVHYVGQQPYVYELTLGGPGKCVQRMPYSKWTTMPHMDFSGTFRMATLSLPEQEAFSSKVNTMFSRDSGNSHVRYFLVPVQKKQLLDMKCYLEKIFEPAYALDCKGLRPSSIENIRYYNCLSWLNEAYNHIGYTLPISPYAAPCQLINDCNQGCSKFYNMLTSLGESVLHQVDSTEGGKYLRGFQKSLEEIQPDSILNLSHPSENMAELQRQISEPIEEMIGNKNPAQPAERKND